MTKDYRVGDEVRIIRQVSDDCTLGASIGGSAVITGEFDGVTYPVLYCDGDVSGYLTRGSIEPTNGRYHNERLTDAEAKIAALEAKVAALSKARGITFTTGSSASSVKSTNRIVGKALYQNVQTPNQRRADVIQRARMFVVDLERRAESDDRNGDGNWLFNGRTTKLTFHVNAKKGVVTALAHGRSGNKKLYDKAFAKCHPNDVFNADIGKAIAAGKLYGVDILQEFVDAPNPTEVVVGMRVESATMKGETYLITEIDGDEARTDGTTRYWRKSRINVAYVIIEDSDAVYS